jgi:hypothetical protein
MSEQQANPGENPNQSKMATMFSKFRDNFASPSEILSGTNLSANLSDFSKDVSLWGLVALLLVVAVVVYTFVRDFTLQKTELGSINTVQTATQLQKIKDADLKQPLRNFYVKTALNCCCLGDWKNNYVDLIALQYAILQGYRCLDFEIYSVNDQPVVAASTNKKNFYHMETFNHLPFADVCRTINSYAFTQAPNKEDPLLISLRIKSSNTAPSFIKGIIDGIKTFPTLGPEYNYEFGGHNLSKEPIGNFKGKVVIIVDVSNQIVNHNCTTDPTTKVQTGECLNQYINIGTNSPFLHKLDYEMGVKNTGNMTDLIEHNKKNMSLVFPDAPFTTNVNFNVAKSMGCALIGMMPQLDDANLDAYNAEFDKAGCAFILKPPELCYQPVTIETPKPQDPALSFAGRSFSTDYASWSV